MNNDPAGRQPCFGDLSVVFPPAENGLRASPDTCLTCAYKTECLKTAMARESGLRVQEEMVTRAYESGVIGFFERWSRKKQLHERQKKN
jgi:hypothetical protein